MRLSAISPVVSNRPGAALSGAGVRGDWRRWLKARRRGGKAGRAPRLRRGGGTALPGLVAERIDPEVIEGLAGRLGQGNVLITGTNGKTTTARLLRSIATAAKMDT